MRAFLTLLISVFLSCTVTASFAAGDKRVALVIGNSAYRKFPALPNPRNDAEDVSAMLKRIGFTVIGGPDLTREAMRDSLRQFARAAQDAEAAMVFYAGHGLQYRGRNYLVPIDAKLEDEFDLDYETVRVDDVVEELNRADGPRILILDACRNLPLQTKSKDAFSASGLAKLSGRGLIVAYATQANQVAYDGKGRNSIFTGAFIKSVEEPGLDVTQVFQRVSMNVDKVTGGRQTPELSLSYPGQFFFNKGETEREAWPRARASNDPDQLRDFITRFPSSFLVDDAKDLIRRIEASRRDGAQVARADEPPRPAAPGAPAPTRRPDDNATAAAAAKAKEDADKLAWQQLQEEQRRRAEQRQQAEKEQAANDARERQRIAQEDERRRIESRRAELEKLVEEARQKKLAEERSATEARERAANEAKERQRLALEAKQEEDKRRAEARQAEQERVAEAARQKKLAEERAVAETKERQRLALEAKQEEDRRRAEARRLDQERVAEETRQRILAEQQAAADAKERQRLALEAKQEEDKRRAEALRAEADRVAEAARQRRLAAETESAERQQRLALMTPPSGGEPATASGSPGDDSWAALEQQQRRRAEQASATRVGIGGTGSVAAAPALQADPSVQTTLAMVKSRETASSSALAPDSAGTTAADRATSNPVRLALNDPSQPLPQGAPPVSGFPSAAVEHERLVRDIQAELGRIGCTDDDPDGKWDKDSRDALRRFGRHAKLTPIPTDPSEALLDDLKTRPARFCPLECGAGERVSGDQCVAVARPEAKPVIEKKAAKPRPAIVQRPSEPRPVAQAPRPKAAPPQAPVATATAAPKPRVIMGVGF